MNSLKVCFIGVGSIAKRHMKNLRIIAEKRKIKLTIDALRRRLVSDEEQGSDIHRSYIDYMKLPDNYDVIFITNPTEFHLDTMYKVLNKSKSFFIEKPLTSIKNMDRFKEIIFPENRIYYIACPLRYTKVIQYLKRYIEDKRVTGVRCISSSYLPDWRPEVDYRKTYSADASLGGGVSIDLIHEWDYLCYLLGEPEKVYSIIGKKSALEVHSDDIAVYIAEYRDKVAELHLDYFGRFPIRRLQLFGKSETLEADLLGESISFTKEGKVLYLKEGRDAYQKKELQHFFAIVQGKAENDSTLQNACRVLRIARGEMGE